MESGEVVVLIGVISLGIIALSMVYFLRTAVRAARAVEEAARDLREKGLPLIEDMHTMVEDTHEELKRVHGVLSKAQAISDTVDAAGRIAYLGVTNPVVKGAAIASGVRGATRAVIKGGGGEDGQ